MDKHFTRWLLFAPLGLVIIGAGLCLTIEAGFLKHSGADMMVWFKSGTIGLVVLMAGLSVFGKAIVERTHYERRQMRKNRQSKS